MGTIKKLKIDEATRETIMDIITTKGSDVEKPLISYPTY